MKKKYYLIAIGLALALSIYTVQATGIFVRFAGSDTVYKAYQTAQQFFNDGGAKDFSNVQVMEQEQSFGSVGVSNEYNSTTTGATGGLAHATLKTGNGTLGSVIMTVAGAGYLKIYDATTTNVNLRTNKTATTSLPILASFGANQAIGTYVFDNVFYNGLLFAHVGAVGSSTITFR